MKRKVTTLLSISLIAFALLQACSPIKAQNLEGTTTRSTFQLRYVTHRPSGAECVQDLGYGLPVDEWAVNPKKLCIGESGSLYVFDVGNSTDTTEIVVHDGTHATIKNPNGDTCDETLTATNTEQTETKINSTTTTGLMDEVCNYAARK